MLQKSIILPSMEEEEGGGGGEKKIQRSEGENARVPRTRGNSSRAGARVHTLRKRQAKGSLSGLSR
jgi:hypothetical protein